MTTGDGATHDEDAMMPKPQKEHEWLHKLVGEWTYEGEAQAPGQPPVKMSGTETVRSLGGLWTVGESRGGMSGSGEDTSLMTLGYDPALQRYTGTWVGSMMPYLWVYDGSLDADERVLTLNSQGPSMAGGGPANYRDVIEFVEDDYRLLRGQMQGEDGAWTEFMVTHYRRRR